MHQIGDNMDIQMIGINYQNAGIDIREKFSFTKTEIIEALQKIKALEEISGCILLSTCNRTELWVSYVNGCEKEMSGLLCSLKGVEKQEYGQYFISKSGEDAVEYLFYLASGLKSQILGEDQILTQIKDACALSRECFCTDKVLETLFRMAVTAGKAVKTNIAIPVSNHSAPLAAISQLEKEGISFEGKKSLVIGNGAMGKMTAQLLMDRGADVTVTIRQYRSGIVDVPFQAKRIDYSRRYEYIPECDYVFSATASPNLTIRREELEKMDAPGKKVFVDLAVPRDIEKGIANLQGVTLYDMDYFKVDKISEEVRELLNQADELLKEKIDEYIVWYEAMDAVPVLLQLSKKAATDVILRIEKPVKKAAPQQLQSIEETVETAVQKVVNKLMFSIRDSVDVATFRECVSAMQDLYQDE